MGPRKYRPYGKDSEISYTLGTYPTIELLTRKPDLVERIVTTTEGPPSEGLARIRALCSDLTLPLEENDRLIARLSPREDCHALGIFRKFASPLDPDTHHIVLHQPASRGNVGSVVRSMVGFGLNNLILIRPAVDFWHPNVIRASMGAIFQIGFRYYDSIEEYRSSTSIPQFVLSKEGEVSLDDLEADSASAFIFGSEGEGVPPNVTGWATAVRIAQENTIDSLNLSVSAGITFYSLARKCHS